MKKLVITSAIVLTLGAELAMAGGYNLGRPGKNIIPIEPPVPAGNCLTYDYVDLNYVYQDFGTQFFDEGKGFSGNFSKSLGRSMFVTGSYERAGYEYDWVDHIVDADTHRYRLGFGAKHSVAKCFDITIQGGGQYYDSEFVNHAAKDFNSWGWYAGPGFRFIVGKRLELFGNAFYSKNEGDHRESMLSQHNAYNPSAEVDDYGWRFTPGMIYYVTENVGLKVAAEFEKEDTSLLFGVRVAY